VQRSLADNDAAWLVEACFDGTAPVLSVERCPVMELSATTTTPLNTTTTTTVTTTLASVATTLASDAAVSTDTTIIAVVVSVLLLLCLLGALALAACLIRRSRAMGARDGDEHVSLFEDYEAEEAVRDLRTLQASSTGTIDSGHGHELARADGSLAAMNAIDELMDELNAHSTDEELAWTPVLDDDPVKRLSVAMIKGMPQFNRKPSIRASMSKRVSDRAIARVSVVRKVSERDVSIKGPRTVRRQPTTYDDLRADAELDSSDGANENKAVVDDDDADDDDADDADDVDDADESANEQLPELPDEPRPGRVFLRSVEASHLAASGAAAKRVAAAVYQAVNGARSAERAATVAGDVKTAQAIHKQSIVVAQATRDYSVAPSKVTATSIVDALERLITLAVAYDVPES
jgi:hypothetical protein